MAGTAYFVTMAALLADSDGGDVIIGTAIAGGVLFAGMGAAAGVGIDALITRNQVIYRKSSRRNQSQRFAAVRPRTSRRRSHGEVLTPKTLKRDHHLPATSPTGNVTYRQRRLPITSWRAKVERVSRRRDEGGDNWSPTRGALA